MNKSCTDEMHDVNYLKKCGGKAKILFTASPKGAFDAAFPPLDDKYAIELYNQGYVTETSDYFSSSPLDKTNVLTYGIVYPDRLPFVNEKCELYGNKNPTVNEIKEFVSSGGGLLLNIGYVGYGDINKVIRNINDFLKDFGAEIIWEKVTDELHKDVYNYSARYTYYYSTNILNSELTHNVSKFWYPGGKDSHAVTTYSMKALDDAWVVDIKGNDTASTKSIVKSPILMAHRTFGRGRIVIVTMDPRYGIASGSHEAYGGYILNDNADDKQLYRNIYDWLGQPSMEQGRVFKKASEAPEIKTPIALKPPEECTYKELKSKLNDHENEQVNLNQYKGLIGIKSDLSGGKSSIEDLCFAAIDKGYNFLVFSEDYSNMTEIKYNELVKRCNDISKSTDNFTAIPGLYLPPSKTEIEPRYYGRGKRIVFNLKCWPTVKEATSPEWYQLLFNHNWPSVIVTEPNLNGNTPWQLMFYTGFAVETYNGNKCIDEASDIYRKLVSSDYRLIPAAVSYIDSTDGINEYNGAVTYVCSRNIEEIKDNLKTFGGSGTSYLSTGPVIDFKYASAENAAYAGIGETLFLNQNFALNISVNSSSKLKEVTLYRDTAVYRKYYPDSKSFEKTIFVTKDANHAFTVEAVDVMGKRAVSNSARTSSPYHNFSMCTDKQNVIHNFFGKEGSDGIILSFWLSGKDLGQLYINKSSYEIAPAGEDASWAAVSVVEGLPKVWMYNGRLGGEDPAVSTVARNVKLSTDDAVVVDNVIDDDFFEGHTVYTTFRPKLRGDNILMVEGNYVAKKNITLGDSINNLEMILFRVMGNYAHEPYSTYVYSPDYSTKISGNTYKTSADMKEAFIPVEGEYKLKEGGYIGFWASRTGNIMLFPLDDGHDISFGLTNSRRVFEETGSEVLRNYLAYGFRNPGEKITAGTPIKYKLLFVVDGGNEIKETHADEIRAAYRLGASQGMEAEIDNGTVTGNKFILNVKAQNNYAVLRLKRRYMPNGVLPVIVEGTVSGWDSVEYDYDTRSFRKLYGIEGKLYSAVDIDLCDRNLFIGNPVVSSSKELKINLLKGDSGEIQVVVHNPSDSVIEAEVKSSIALKNVFLLDYKGTWKPGESKYLNLNMVSTYSFEINGPINVALNVNVSADSADKDNLPHKAVDGLCYTKWQSLNGESHFLTVDMGKKYKVNRFIVKHAGSGMEPSNLNTVDFDIQYCVDESHQWMTAVTVKDNVKNITVHDIDPVNARYVRLVVNKANSSGADSKARIYGFEIYANYVDTTKNIMKHEMIPAVPVIKGVSDNQIMEVAAPDWTVPEGTKITATLSKDRGPAQIFVKGTMINQPGYYTLTVNAISETNGMVSVARIDFKIKKTVANSK